MLHKWTHRVTGYLLRSIRAFLCPGWYLDVLYETTELLPHANQRAVFTYAQMSSINASRIMQNNRCSYVQAPIAVSGAAHSRNFMWKNGTRSKAYTVTSHTIQIWIRFLYAVENNLAEAGATWLTIMLSPAVGSVDQQLCTTCSTVIWSKIMYHLQNDKLTNHYVPPARRLGDQQLCTTCSTVSWSKIMYHL
jgi:glucuronate isomerase